MVVAGIVVLAFAVLAIVLFVTCAERIPKPVMRFIGYLLLVVSFLESLLIIWILAYVWISDWSLWGLSLNDFWKEQLTAIYFIKEWFYTWIWNDLLDFLLVFMPAIVFLAIRTTVTSALGFWSLTVARR